MVCLYFYFFFFKQKTAYEMRISDWSSDVCSSDLGHTWRGTGMFNSWIRLDWGIIDNPVLSVMAQALTGYRMRTSNDHCSIPVEGSASIQRTLEKYKNAATRRDFSGADDLFQNMLKKIKGSLSPARQHDRKRTSLSAS